MTGLDSVLNILKETLEPLGEDATGYLGEILEAAAIHVKKDTLRRALWKEYPAKDQSFQIRVKGDRLYRLLDADLLTAAERDNALEECYDLINYATFCSRKLQDQEVAPSA